MSASLEEQAREALRLAEANPAESAVLARAVARQALRDHALAPRSIAERVLGMTALQLENPDVALRHLRTAVRLGRQAGSPELAAEAQMGLAFALNARGRGAQALRHIEAALSSLSGVAAARAQAQRGAILLLLGRLDEALADFQAALPALRRAKDDVWVQRVLYNRAVLYGYQQEFAAAEADLQEAAQLCARLDLDLSLGFVHENLGWISGLRGDVPAALHYLELAEQRLRAHGAPVGELLTDRCQLLLSVRLLPEAMQAAQQAVLELAQQHRNIGLAEVRLLLAQVAIMDGQASLGLEQARTAVREFGRQGRSRWVTLARFTVLRARLAAGQRPGTGPRVGVRSLERAAEDLAAAGWPYSALEARLLAGQLAVQAGWTGQAWVQFQQASAQRGRGPALQRAQGWYAEARHRWISGNRRGAIAATRRALRVLDEHRASLGATDLRAHASGHRVEMAEFGLHMAFDSGQPARVLEWAEQGRASHLMLRPVRAPSDPDLAAALSELRLTVSEIFKRRGTGGKTAALERRQVALERQIRDYHRRLPAERATGLGRRLEVRGLCDSLGDAALLEFIRLGDMLHVVTVVSGQLRMCELGPAAPAYELIDRVRFALHRLVRRHANDDSLDGARTLLTDAAERLDTLLLGPVKRHTTDRPLVVVPTGALQALPWPILPSCVGRPVTVTPSATLWAAAPISHGRPGRTVVAAGPGLPGAETEALAVAALHKVTALVGGAATVEAVTTGLDGSSLAHLAAHGRIHSDNPLFTSLTLADGPLTVYDIEQLHQAPQVVILAACDVGRSAVKAGDELMGLSATFLSLGTRHVIASVVPVPDAETAPLMVALHQLLATGQPVTSALAQAQRNLDHRHSRAMAAAAGFVSIGTGARSVAA